MKPMLSELARSRFAAFREYIENTDPRARWLVLTHNNPDPDALAAAAALAKVLRSGFGHRATPAYGGIIGRAENQEMVRSLDLDFCRGSSAADRAIHDHFNAQALPRLLGRIRNPRLPLNYFETLREALANLYGVDTLILSRLGPVAQPDIVPEIADLLLRLEGCTWSMCSGLHEDRLYCSIRTTNARTDASRIMRRLVGRQGRGGGHGMIAGGWIPKAKGGEDAVRRQQDRLAARLAGLLRKDPSRIAPITGA